MARKVHTLPNPLSPISLSLVLAASLTVFLTPHGAQAQETQVTFDLSLTYTAHSENSVPSPLQIQPSSGCYLQNSSGQVFYDPLGDEISYHISTRVTATFFYRNDGGVGINCPITAIGLHSQLYIGDLTFYPSTGEILAALITPTADVGVSFTEIAYLWYIDNTTPGHSVYHFRGNDALFALAQQTLGVNFSGVELLFDVQAP